MANAADIDVAPEPAVDLGVLDCPILIVDDDDEIFLRKNIYNSKRLKIEQTGTTDDFIETKFVLRRKT